VRDRVLSKVPEVALGFWIIKIFATTLGEVGGNAVTMSLALGYLAGTAIFAAALLILLSAQIKANRFHPYLSTKYRCHRLCHLQISLLGGRGRAAGGRRAPGVAQRPTDGRLNEVCNCTPLFYRVCASTLGS
jgi:hypothetical protein